MAIQDRLSQALHNEKACDFLLDSGDFGDWAITTAFYAALHFVQHSMFPLKVKISDKKNQTYPCFDDYYTRNNFEMLGVNRHKATVSLVKEHLNPIHSRYRRLKDLCHSARYNSYKVDPLEVTLARTILAEIKDECTRSIDIQAPAALGTKSQQR